MKKIHLIPFAFLLTLAAAPCSAQKAQAPLSAAAAQSKQQGAIKPFTHAEMVQFFHTVQTEAARWKATINSVQPSVLHIYGSDARAIEQQKSALLGYLDDIEKLHIRSNEKSSALDLTVEFETYDDLSLFKGEVRVLSFMLGAATNGQYDDDQLAEVYKEAEARRLTLGIEILDGINHVTMATLAEEVRAARLRTAQQKPAVLPAPPQPEPVQSGGQTVWNGTIWAQSRRSDKVTYVQGIMHGVLLGDPVFEPKPGEDFLFRANGKTPTPDEVVAGVDSFYSKPENLPICVGHAVFIAWVSLTGHALPESTIERQRELDGHTGCH